MPEMVLYARKEQTADKFLLDQAAATGIELTSLHRDVVMYTDKEATQQACRWPWFYGNSKPTRRNKTTCLNNIRYRLEWLPDKD